MVDLVVGFSFFHVGKYGRGQSQVYSFVLFANVGVWGFRYCSLFPGGDVIEPNMTRCVQCVCVWGVGVGLTRDGPIIL